MQPLSPVERRRRRRSALLAVGALLSLGAALGCTGSDGDTGPAGPPGPPADPDPFPTAVAPGGSPPEIVVSIDSVLGASGISGNFEPGDTLVLGFRVERAGGEDWLLSELASGEVLVSGPTVNYQRVIPLQGDVQALATTEADGSHVYTFPVPLPAVYQAPYNDTTDFGLGDGELAGQALLSGTYTVGLSFTWEFQVGTETYTQVGEATRDFLLGTGAGALAPRAVSQLANCNQCHVRLEAHAGLRRDFTMCLLCHTSGAEDRNDPLVAGGTPKVSIESRVMFHKIHNGAHLPSVLGVGIQIDGTRQYDLPPKENLLVGWGGVVHDFTTVGFPVFPNRSSPMPVDPGFAALPAPAKEQELQIRRGITSCFVCHGDPDGTGPILEPADGDLILAEPTRRACGACHDDIDWEKKFVGPLGEMPPQLNDATCNQCHESTFGGALAVTDGHRHPLDNPAIDPGLRIELLAVEDAGPSGGDGALDPGDLVRVRFTLTDDTGLEVDPLTVTAFRAVVAGPDLNRNLLLDATLPAELLIGPQPFELLLPELRQLEFAGDSTAVTGEVFATAAAPHLDLAGAETVVRVRRSTGGGASTLATAATARQNFVDVDDPAGFARDDHVVLDDGVLGAEEYLRIQLVDGNRLWFSSPATPAYAPGTVHAHPAGASVLEVLLQELDEDLDYDLDEAAGTVTEIAEFGPAAAVVVSYAAPFEVPAAYPLALNASPDLDEANGVWTGKSFADGTYAVGLWAWREFDYQDYGDEAITYRSASPSAVVAIAGGAGPLVPYATIADSQACNACHQDLWFHGGSERGFDTCLLCHGTAGAEDRPRYVAANAPETPGQVVSFRSMVHKIHRGAQLDDPTGFQVVGEGEGAYPDNFEANDYAEIVYPAMPGGVLQCAKCHGPGNEAALIPSKRDHPTEQGKEVLVWTEVCGSCHDSSAAQAHIEIRTAPSGAEACAVCHLPGKVQDALLSHGTY